MLAYAIYLMMLAHFVVAVDKSCLHHLLKQYCDDTEDLRSIIFASSLNYTEHRIEMSVNHTYFVRQLDYSYLDNPAKVKCLVATAFRFDDDLVDLFRSYFICNDFTRSRVIVMFDGQSALDDLFLSFWKNFVSDVIVVVQNVAYTYYPITQGLCEPVAPVALGECHKINADLQEGQAEYFRNCTIDVISQRGEPFVGCDTFDKNKGLEVAVLRLVVDKLQLRSNFLVQGCSMDFRRPRRPYAAVLLGGLRISMNAAPLYIPESASLFLPKAKVLEPWKNTVRIFDVSIWTCLLGSIVCVAAICTVQNKDNIASNLMFTLAVLISSVPRVPTRLRQIFAFWTVSSIIIVNAYLGLLTSFLFKSTPKHQIRTLDEMVEAGYKFGGYFANQKFFDDTGAQNESTKYYYNNYIKCYFVDDITCLQSIIKGDTVIFSYTHAMNYFLTVNHVHSIYKAPTLINDLLAIGLMDSWYQRRLIECVLRLNEFGIVQYLDGYSWKEEEIEEVGFSSLTLRHLYFIFVVCTFGLLLAFVVFLAERYHIIR